MTQPRRRIRYDPANDLYVVLDVLPSATLGDLRRSFRQRAKEVHPDLHPDKPNWAHEQFQRLNEAYDILSNTSLREEYDEKRRRYRRERGPDGVAWWDRPHPRGKPAAPPPDESHAAPSASESRYQAGAMPPRRRPTAPYNRRRDRFRFYQLLFVVSSVIFCGSFLAVLTPRSAELATSTPEVAQIDPSLTPIPALLACNSPGITITSPAEGAEVTRSFSIQGSAYDWNFRYYTIEVAPVPWEEGMLLPTETPEFSYQGWAPVVTNVLFPNFPARSLATGDYVARLTVYLDNGGVRPPCEVRFRVVSTRLRRR